ncbi:hypothetical protein SAMN05421644_10790 [Allochromatium warmingii]|uniref:Uncharacterized protein n=1 Tax=Allochromatium warmingii TaxID=61595 RepID=A0A1H3D209_ALLWA|nr:hypothetical protein SAMN05421644_10790 [Allochromatium warmingii]
MQQTLRKAGGSLVMTVPKADTFMLTLAHKRQHMHTHF